VEAGKKAAAEVLELKAQMENLLADGQERNLDEMATALGLASPEPLFWILRHLCHNHRGIKASGDWGNPLDLRFGALV
jgi:glucose-6-phosphate isomerase